MNARELRDWIAEHKRLPQAPWPHTMETILRALRLLAAAEANDGTTPETKGLIDLCRRLELARNGLAARVGELENELRRLTQHHPECICSTCLNERTKEWFTVSDNAARSKP